MKKKECLVICLALIISLVGYSQSKMPSFTFPPDVWEILEQSVSKADAIKVIGKHYVEIKLITASEGEYESIYIDGNEFFRNSRVLLYSGIYNAYFGKSDYYQTVTGKKPDDITFICGRIFNNGTWYFQYVFSVSINDSLIEYAFLVPYADTKGSYFDMSSKSIYFYATNALR